MGSQCDGVAAGCDRHIGLFDQLFIGADDFGFRARLQFETLVGLVFKVFDGLVHDRQLAVITGFIAVTRLLVGLQRLIDLPVKKGLPGRFGGKKTAGKHHGGENHDTHRINPHENSLAHALCYPDCIINHTRRRLHKFFVNIP